MLSPQGRVLYSYQASTHDRTRSCLSGILLRPTDIFASSISAEKVVLVLPFRGGTQMWAGYKGPITGFAWAQVNIHCAGVTTLRSREPMCARGRMNAVSEKTAVEVSVAVSSGM